MNNYITKFGGQFGFYPVFGFDQNGSGGGLNPLNFLIFLDGTNESGAYGSDLFYTNTFATSATPKFSVHVMFFYTGTTNVKRDIFGRQFGFNISLLDGKAGTLINFDYIDQTFASNSIVFNGGLSPLTWYLASFIVDYENPDFVRCFLNGTEKTIGTKTGTGTNISNAGFYASVGYGGNNYFNGGITYVATQNSINNIHSSLYSSGNFGVPSPVLLEPDGEYCLIDNQPSVASGQPLYITDSGGDYNLGGGLNWFNTEAEDKIPYPAI